MEDTEPKQEKPRVAASSSGKTYTAILYFHGMGTPRRHQEISRLTDALDQFAECQDAASVGRLRGQEAAFEPPRAYQEEEVAFVSLIRLVKRFGDRFRWEGAFRIYEGYWSPSTAGGYSSARVFWWLLLRTASPIRVLCAPWRAYQRVRLSTLYKMYSEARGRSVEQHYRELEAHYREFENWAARHRYPRGSMRQFKRFLLEKLNPGPKHRAISSLFTRWQMRFLAEQSFVLILCLTALLGLVDFVVTLAALLTSWADTFFPVVVEHLPVIPSFASIFRAHHYTLWALSILTTYFFFAARYQLSNFWSDVMFWTVQREKDVRYSKRKEILRAGEEILLQVLRDPDCNRVVVLGHSLGSAIAQECLLRLGRRKRAWKDRVDRPDELDRLDRISHFITIGSPIDRLYYFFETHDVGVHRYNRISEQLRGDTSHPPFSNGKETGTQWINIWDNADPISAKLFTSRKQIPNHEAILNIGAMSSYRPNFIGAHTDYFFSKAAMRVIFWITIMGRLPTRDSLDDGLATAFRRSAMMIRPFAWGLVLAIPWLIFASEFGLLLSMTPIAYRLLAVLAAVVLIFAVLQLGGAVMDKIRPVRIDRLAQRIP